MVLVGVLVRSSSQCMSVAHLFSCRRCFGAEVASGRSFWDRGGSSFPGLIGPGVPGVAAAGRQQLFSLSGERDGWQISY